LAVLTAILVFVTPRTLLYKISLLQIFLTVLGLVLTASTMIRAGSHIHIGLFVCVIGFMLTGAASTAKFKRLASGAPSHRAVGNVDVQAGWLERYASMSMTWRGRWCCPRPRVKSGHLIGRPFLATERSVSSDIALQAAAS